MTFLIGLDGHAAFLSFFAVVGEIICFACRFIVPGSTAAADFSRSGGFVEENSIGFGRCHLTVISPV
jgi:hypothetical protein